MRRVKLEVQESYGFGGGLFVATGVRIDPIFTSRKEGSAVFLSDATSSTPTVRSFEGKIDGSHLGDRQLCSPYSVDKPSSSPRAESL